MSIELQNDSRCLQIISELESRNVSSSELDRCKKELEIMISSDGLGKGDILDDFIEIRNRISENTTSNNNINSMLAYLLGMT